MTERWTDEFLNAKRNSMDPLADAVIDTVLQSEDEQEHFNALLPNLIHNDDHASPAFPEIARQYFADTRKLPEWADLGKIRAGEKLFGRYGPEMVMLLLCKSLPDCYAAKYATKALYATHLLEDYVHRRIVETAQFVVDVMTPGGLDPDNHEGRGIRTAQKVRLLHASIRHILRQRPDPLWNGEEWGQPINQEDMAGTLLSFSYLTLKGLKLLGADLSREEEEIYMHCWNVVGYIMGVDEDLIIETMDEADVFWQRLDQRQFGHSESGTALTKSLIEFMDHIIPGTLFDGFPSALIRHLVGDRIAEFTEVPINLSIRLEEAIISGPIEHLLGDLDHFEHDHQRVASLIGKFNQHLIKALLMTEQLGKGVRFRIPESIAQHDAWREHVPPTPVHLKVSPKVGGWRLVLEKGED